MIVDICVSHYGDVRLVVTNPSDVVRKVCDGGAFVQRANPDSDTLLFEFEPAQALPEKEGQDGR